MAFVAALPVGHIAQKESLSCLSSSRARFARLRRSFAGPSSRRQLVRMEVGEGDVAPDFDVRTDQGSSLSLQSMKGKKVVLFFYPKASTSGCTREAAAFNEKLASFAGVNCQIVGASRDTQEENTKFKSDLDLKFPLLCDESGALTESYGVWKLRRKFGKEFMGIERSTFVIGEDGKIEKSWRGVKVDGHVDEVAATVGAT